MSTVHCIVSGRWRQNGYVLRAKDGSALIIDPGGRGDDFKALVAEFGLQPRAIVNTHAHYDHLGAVVDLIEAYDIPFYLHAGDRALLRQANIYKALFGETVNIRVPATFSDLAAVDGKLTIGSIDIEIIETPGHTKGSICFRIDDLLFSGDTLLPAGPGRVDLPGGSAVDMKNSLARIAELPGHLMMYPGHGEATSLAQALTNAQNRTNIA